MLYTDHLGTPRVGSNASGVNVWSWSAAHNAFGGITAPTGTKTINLRYAGQYFDTESGLFYNWNRYYNPTTGRYISSDPIGLGGGLNTFAYAGANPVMYVDPEGLAWTDGEALFHYYHGGGKSVTLGGIGHLNTIKNSATAQGVIQRFGEQVDGVAYRKASRSAVGQHTFSHDFSNSYDFTGDVFFIGGATLSGKFIGILNLNGTGDYYYQGDALISFYDRFSDPYDIFDFVPGELDFDGTPYSIYGEWRERYNGSGSLGYCP